VPFHQSCSPRPPVSNKAPSFSRIFLEGQGFPPTSRLSVNYNKARTQSTELGLTNRPTRAEGCFSGASVVQAHHNLACLHHQPRMP
jgi:hypothetical protein